MSSWAPALFVSETACLGTDHLIIAIRPREPMTLDQAVALSLLEDLPGSGLPPVSSNPIPNSSKLAAPLLERARAERIRAAEAGINVLAWNDPHMPAAIDGDQRRAARPLVSRHLECLNQPVGRDCRLARRIVRGAGNRPASRDRSGITRHHGGRAAWLAASTRRRIAVRSRPGRTDCRPRIRR